MKKVLLGMMFVPLASFAGDKIDKSIDVPSDGKIIIENPRGEVDIKSWDKAQFQVVGELDDLATGYTLKNKGNVTEFIVELPKSRRGWNNKGDGSRLTIYMPKNSELDFTGVNVDVSVAKLYGGASITTVNGDIKANELEGRVQLETVNGDVDAYKLAGKLFFETVNGDIEDRDSSGELRFNAVNGDIESNTAATEIRLENVNGEVDFTIQSLKDLRLNTVNGEIEVRMQELQEGGRINLDSVSGSIDLYFPQDVNARFDIDAHAGGRIVNKLSNDKVQKAKYGPSKALEFTLNDGSADIEIDTVSGRITLKKQ